MDYIIKPSKANDGSFLVSSLKESDIRANLLSSQVCISDIDDTIGKSATIYLVKKSFRPRHLSWVFGTLLAYLTKQENIRYKRWFRFYEDFLKDKNTSIPQEVLVKLLFPGVMNFYSRLETLNPDLKKIFISGTIKEIVDVYKQILKFDEGYYLIWDKENCAINLRNSYKEMDESFVLCNSDYDVGIVKTLESATKFCLSIWVAKSKRYINEGFLVNINRNYKCLDDLLKD